MKLAAASFELDSWPTLDEALAVLRQKQKRSGNLMLRLNDIKARFEGQHIHDEDEIELVTEVELRWADSRSTPAHLCIWRAENEKDPDHIAVSLYFPEGSDQAALEIPMERGEWTIENVAEVFGIPMDAAIWEAEKAE